MFVSISSSNQPAVFDELARWVERGLVAMVSPEVHHAVTLFAAGYSFMSLMHLMHFLRTSFFQVIGHRQAGKSTTLVLLDHYIAQNQVCVGSTVLESIGACLDKSTPMVCLCKYMVDT